jgi:predicted esterase
MTPDPHAQTSALAIGPSPETAALTLVLIHGRGATAQSMLSLLPALRLPEARLSVIAPQAAGQTWYPYSFLAPMERNQPFLDSALARIGSVVDGLLQKIDAQRIALLGFSQGACLASEFAARHPHPYGAIIGLSGGLIGPPGTPRHYAGALPGTSVFLGCSDPDMHIPFERVEETAAVFTRMGAGVDLRRYPGMPHAVNEDELDAVRGMLGRLIAAAPVADNTAR